MATGFIMLDTPNPTTPQGVYPRRGGAKLSGTCIVHTSEGDWRSGVQALINLVRIRADYGCYHQGCDWEDIAQFYPWEWETWQDSETNNWAVGISAACRTTDWGNMPADVEEGFYRNMAHMAADFVRYMDATYGIQVPLKRITGAQARARVPGFCAHGDSGIARSDPGANFNWTRFFAYAQQDLDGTVQEDEVTQAQIDEIVHRVNVFAQKNSQDTAKVVIAETWAAATHNKNLILDALKQIPQIDDSLIEDLRTKLDVELDESLQALNARIEEKLSNVSITLKAE